MFSKLFEGIRSIVKGGKDLDWNYSDRRELIRLRCHYDVDFVAKGKKHKGKVVDMSLKGMKIRGFAPVKKGDIVEVTYAQEIMSDVVTIKCEVKWCRTRERDYVVFAGLTYSEPDQVMSRSWIKPVLQQLGFQKELIYQQRKFVRAECFLPGNIIYGHGKMMDGRLYNLGVGGALVETRFSVEELCAVELQIGPLEDYEPFSITGQVLNIRKQGNLYLHSIEFSDPSDKSLDQLGVYLKHLLTNSWVD